MLLFASACVIAALGFLLLGIPMPLGEKWKNLRIARNFLSISYFTLAALSILSLLMHGYEDGLTFRDVIVLIIASFHALLFTLTLLLFIQPHYVCRERIIPQIAIISTAGLLLILSLFFGKIAFPYIFYTAIVIYLTQLIFYTVLFRNKYALCLKQIQEYYDDDEDKRLRWVRNVFYTALTLGLTALFTLFTNWWINDIFIVIYTTFYTYIAYRFLYYKNNEVEFVLPAVTHEHNNQKKEKLRDLRTSTEPVMTTKDLRFKASLEKWIMDKKFAEKDIGVEEIANSLGTDTNYLRYYFRTFMHSDFRTWRSELRIREAQSIMNENPAIPLSDVCEMVGFNDKGNFHRQFQKFTGATPTLYKNDCCEKTNVQMKETYEQYQ